jgi:hypothetical protein
MRFLNQKELDLITPNIIIKHRNLSLVADTSAVTVQLDTLYAKIAVRYT